MVCLLCLAGDIGFEPMRVGIKIRCLDQLGESPANLIYGIPCSICTNPLGFGDQCAAADTKEIDWLQETDSNRRSSGYEPDELPLLHPAINLVEDIGFEPITSECKSDV